MKRTFIPHDAFRQRGPGRAERRISELENAAGPRQNGRAAMSHEIAKLILEQANTFLERREAIKTAQSLGMPLNEIEEYLDWLEYLRQHPQPMPPPPQKGEEKA